MRRSRAGEFASADRQLAQDSHVDQALDGRIRGRKATAGQPVRADADNTEHVGHALATDSPTEFLILDVPAGAERLVEILRKRPVAATSQNESVATTA
jgi:hypothetical protein